MKSGTGSTVVMVSVSPNSGRLDPRTAAAMLEETQRVGLQPSPFSDESGYGAVDVDRFFARLSDVLRANRPISPFVRRAASGWSGKGTGATTFTM